MFTFIYDIMKTNNTQILGIAAGIIKDSGLAALSIQKLAEKLGVNRKELDSLFLEEDNDIILIILLALENDLILLIRKIKNRHTTPEAELKLFFKGLYSLFLQKTHYLSILFDKNLRQRDNEIKKAIRRIKSLSVKYLTDLIEEGKDTNTFKTPLSSRFLAHSILASFRSIMNDEQRMKEMIIELKNIENQNIKNEV